MRSFMEKIYILDTNVLIQAPGYQCINPGTLCRGMF